MILTTSPDGAMNTGVVTDGQYKGKRAFVRTMEIAVIVDEDDVRREAKSFLFEGPSGEVWAEYDDETNTWFVQFDDCDEPFKTGLDQEQAVHLAYESAWVNAGALS